MTRIVILDTGPLGLVTHPGAKPEVKDCQSWLGSLLRAGVGFMVPAIGDYELRRELIRAGRLEGLANHDALVQKLGFLPIGREVIQETAQLWAEARRLGRPTASDLALDGHCFLEAHANATTSVLNREPGLPSVQVVMATTNPKHLTRMTLARHWRDLNQDFD